MKRYLFCLTTHIAGIVLLTACALLAFLHEMWFCSITAVLLTVGTSFSLYRIQMRQTSMIQRIVECMKRNDFSQTASPSFSDRAMQELANDLSEVLKGIRNRMLDEEVKLQYYENLLDKVDTAVIVTDHQGRAEWMNKAARPLLGEHKQLPGQVLEALRKKQQVAHLTIQDLPMDLAIASSVIHLQGRERWIISLKNIHSALEHTEMEAWQKLIRVLTHEIMNSITPIISLAETLSERSRENPHDERTRTHIQKGLEVIHRRSKGLLEFVENYRKLTRIAPPVREQISVQAFFDDLRRLYPSPLFHFTAPSGLTFLADRTQMEQIFINLLKNASEACIHTPDANVEISAQPVREGISLVVSDNGEGMLPEVTERIFVPFFTTKPSGSGIGLSLCKQIITLHNGRIQVQSQPGKGSKFTIILPQNNLPS